MSHRDPPQVLRLVRALKEHPSSAVLVRHDQSASRVRAREIEEAGGRLLADDGLAAEWGGWSLLEILLGGLGEAATEHDPDWTIVLSGQDYPLRSHAELDAFLAGSEHDAYLPDLWPLRSLRLRGSPGDEFVLRYGYRHFGAPLVPARLPRRVVYRRELPAPLKPRLGVRRLRAPELPLHVSSDWPTLSREALGAVLRFPAQRPRMMRLYRRSFSPAESFFATALMNEPGCSVGTGPHRFIRFAQGSAHPQVLGSADLEALIASGAHFARKFDQAVDAEVLDELDRLRAAGSARASLGRPWPAETSESP